MGKYAAVAVIRRQRQLQRRDVVSRSLGRGVVENIAYTTGHHPATKPRVLATLGSYVIALVALAGFLAAVARMAR